MKTRAHRKVGWRRVRAAAAVPRSHPSPFLDTALCPQAVSVAPITKTVNPRKPILANNEDRANWTIGLYSGLAENRYREEVLWGDQPPTKNPYYEPLTSLLFSANFVFLPSIFALTQVPVIFVFALIGTVVFLGGVGWVLGMIVTEINSHWSYPLLYTGLAVSGLPVLAHYQRTLNAGPRVIKYMEEDPTRYSEQAIAGVESAFDQFAITVPLWLLGGFILCLFLTR